MTCPWSHSKFLTQSPEALAVGHPAVLRGSSHLPCPSQGGSLAKGTALRGRSDADLVVFLSCFDRFTDQGNRRAEIISEIQAQLEACKRERQFEVKFEISKWENPRVLSFSLLSHTVLDQGVDFDVLPAFDALGESPGMVLRRGEAEPGLPGAVVEAVRLFTSQALCSCVFITTSLQRRKGHLFLSHAKVLQELTVALSWVLVPSIPPTCWMALTRGLPYLEPQCLDLMRTGTSKGLGAPPPPATDPFDQSNP